jgi:hypothetical protein
LVIIILYQILITQSPQLLHTVVSLSQTGVAHGIEIPGPRRTRGCCLCVRAPDSHPHIEDVPGNRMLPPRLEFISLEMELAH